jgi:hypothetical protein
MTHAGPRAEPTAPAPLRYTLELQPETAAQPWRAVLRPAAAGFDPLAADDAPGALVFDTPLALARHLAQFLAPPRRPGLR